MIELMEGLLGKKTQKVVIDETTTLPNKILIKMHAWIC